MNRANGNIPRAIGPAVNDRVAKLGLYREFIYIATHLHDVSSRAKALKEIRTSWRANVGMSGERLEHLMTQALDKLEYIKINVPKRRLAEAPTASKRYDWYLGNPDDQFPPTGSATRERNDLYDRDDVQTKTNWGMGNVDPDMLKRHKELLDRQYFMGPTWKNRPKPLIFEHLSVEEQLRHMLSPPIETPRKVHKNVTGGAAGRTNSDP